MDSESRPNNKNTPQGTQENKSMRQQEMDDDKMLEEHMDLTEDFLQSLNIDISPIEKSRKDAKQKSTVSLSASHIFG